MTEAEIMSGIQGPASGGNDPAGVYNAGVSGIALISDLFAEDVVAVDNKCDTFRDIERWTLQENKYFLSGSTVGIPINIVSEYISVLRNRKDFFCCLKGLEISARTLIKEGIEMSSPIIFLKIKNYYRKINEAAKYLETIHIKYPNINMLVSYLGYDSLFNVYYSMSDAENIFSFDTSKMPIGHFDQVFSPNFLQEIK